MRDHDSFIHLAALVLVGGVAVVAVVSCSTDDCTTTASCDEAQIQPVQDAGNGDGNGTNETGPQAGGPFSFEAIGPQPRVMVDAPHTVVLNVTRSAKQTEDIIVTVPNAPVGVTFDPLTIKGADSKGELVVKVAASAKHGQFDVTVEGITASKEKASTKLTLFARGKPGSIDTTFGTDGKAFVLGKAADEPGQLVVGSKDDLYFVGACASASCAAHLSVDGTLDAGYGGLTAPMSLQVPFATALDSQGRLVVGGGAAGPSVGRYTPAGQVDTPFGVKLMGTAGLPGSGGVKNVLIGAADSIYVTFPTNKSSAAQKIESDGSISSSFNFQGTGGVSLGWFPPTGNFDSSQTSGLAFGQGGVLVVTGVWQSTDGTRGFGVSHYNPTNASPQNDFAGPTNAKTLTSPDAITANARTMLMLPDGRVTAGAQSVGANQALAIFTAAGAADTSFNGSGIAKFSVVSDGAMTGVVRQSDGAIIVGKGNGLARLLPNGTLDPTFGQGGITSAVGGTIALQSDGRIVVATRDVDTNYYVTRVWN